MAGAVRRDRVFGGFFNIDTSPLHSLLHPILVPVDVLQVLDGIGQFLLGGGVGLIVKVLGLRSKL